MVWHHRRYLGVLVLTVVATWAQAQQHLPFGGYRRHSAEIEQRFQEHFAGAAALQLWQHKLSFQGHTYTYQMVGSDPGKGSKTTTIPVFVVPLDFTFSDNTELDATKKGQVGNLSAEQGFLQSPLIQPVDFKSGSVDLGTTQFTDAFQRANFWKLVSAKSPDYHVMLSKPKVLPKISLKVPSNQGQTFQLSNGIKYAIVDDIFTDDACLQYINQHTQIQPNAFVVFLSYNVVIGSGVSFHSSAGPQTYTITMYSDPGIIPALFGPQYNKVANVAVSSHEVGEWLDGPFGNNLMPDGILEVGDTLQAHTFNKQSQGNTYTMQELAFHDWFTCKAPPSTSANGWYSFLGTYKTPDAGCP